MSQLWALVSASGVYVLRYTASADQHPADCGHADECEDVNVWPLDRDPDQANGEGVSYATGDFDFEIGRVADVVIASLKGAAFRKIVAAVPMWKQLDDLYDQDNPEAQARRAFIKGVRAASRAIEESVPNVSSVAGVVAVRSAIAAL